MEGSQQSNLQKQKKATKVDIIADTAEANLFLYVNLSYSKFDGPLICLAGLQL